VREWIVIAALVGLLCASQAWPQPSWRWSSIKKPGAFDTIASGTNDASWTVGVWSGRAAPFARSAFRYQKGQFISFGVPGAVWTEPYDISANSVIVGTYSTLCGPCGDGSHDLHGFVYEHTMECPRIVYTALGRCQLIACQHDFLAYG
jgi:hypothetical protein